MTARPLPRHSYFDDGVFAWELEHLFGDAWLTFGRTGDEDVPRRIGSRAVCARDRTCVSVEGQLLAGPAPGEPPLGDAPGHWRRYSLGALERVDQRTYDIAANWKVILENYAECGHCPGVHPQLNRVSPYKSGHPIAGEGDWRAGTMDIAPNARSMTLSGSSAAPAPLPGVDGDALCEVAYFTCFPNAMIGLHPDYAVAWTVWPVAAEETQVVTDWLFHPEAIAHLDFDPSDAVAFWDLTNRQDWEICELTQHGLRSRGFRGGRLTELEDGVAHFGRRVAEAYLSADSMAASTDLRLRLRRS